MINFLYYQCRFAIPVWLVLLITSILPDNRYSIRVRGGAVSLFLKGRPKRFRLGRDVTLLGLNQLKIGSNVYLAKGCWLNALGGIAIESDVQFGPYVVAVSTKHTLLAGSVSRGSTIFEPVFIGSGSWVASHVTISAGSFVPKGSIVGANSVFNGVFKNPGFYAGCPAKLIKSWS